MPPSTEAIFTLFAQDSLTAGTWAKRFAHSRLVMMMISSELEHRVVEVLRRGHREERVRQAATHLVSLFMITGQAPRSTRDLGDGIRASSTRGRRRR